ncbi:hypothetical protein [Streptomyces sp. NPDC048277]|uniref:hypothetical protein n=1 Tax=Streptomyces sp. NPDC048277 TaxID=3155027 RepID=UPI0033EB665E
MRSRRILATAATGLAAATLAFGFPAQASASTGGGCGTGADGGAIKACISASGIYEIPDMYINWIPSGPCQGVTFYVTDDSTGQTIWSTGIPCKTGHFPEASPWHLVGVNGDKYSSHVTYYGANLVETVNSKEQTFSW